MKYCVYKKSIEIGDKTVKKRKKVEEKIHI